MKIYISLPITGHDINACIARANEAKRRVELLGHSVITPFDVCKSQKHPYAYFVGKDITALLGCDAIYLLSGWSESCGCQLEWHCAQIYRKKIFQFQKDIPNESVQTSKSNKQ